jgi:uncharacterized protein (TIGR03067 family)
VKELWRGRGIVPSQPIAKGDNHFDASLPPLACDPKEARDRLKKAGYKGEEIVIETTVAYVAQDKDGMELWAGTFEVDPTVTPKVWDHRSKDAKKEGKDVLGIYELNSDNLRVACVVGEWKGKEWSGKPRPKAIDPKAADVVLELKRVRPAK